jgi:hypothetical protein
MTNTALETLLRAEQPFTELDRAVRAELAAGRLKKELRAELIALEDSVRDVLDENDVADEALRDVIDGLAGFRPLKYAYADAEDRKPEAAASAAADVLPSQSPLPFPKP